MKKIWKKMMVLMNRKQKWKMVQILIMMVIGAILETASIGLVVPAIQMIMKPSSVEGDGIIARAYRLTGFSNPTYFTVLILALIILGFVLKNVFLYFQNVIMLRFVYTNQFETSQRMMINFMKRPYEYYLNADTSVIQRVITSDVNNMFGLVLACLQLLSEVIIFALLSVTLTTIAPTMILTVASLLVVTLLVIKFVLKPIMRQAGIENQEYYSGLYKWIEESVMGIKEIKIANKENYFIVEYGKCGKGYVSAVQRYNIFNATPRLLIETVCMAGLILYLMIMFLTGQNVTDMVAQIGAFGVAAMRLLPSANRINNHLTSIAYFEPFFMGVSDNLQAEIHDENMVYDEAFYRKKKTVEQLPVKDRIVLDNIVYRYPNTDVWIFDHAHMEIPVGASVGIVGTSGAGKTTIVDILLGLLQIQEGQILADGVEVRDHYESWLKNIGYIPQSIFMVDGSIRRNVAFGYADEEIDDARVWEALRKARLDDFVRGLPEGLSTGIGERGIRISGGQRQRIGIARALFEDPEVLVLDEATSALDNETEAAIMESINSLHGHKTLVIIAHRLQTIEKCDMVYRVENGTIVRER